MLKIMKKIKIKTVVKKIEEEKPDFSTIIFNDTY